MANPLVKSIDIQR